MNICVRILVPCYCFFHAVNVCNAYIINSKTTTAPLSLVVGSSDSYSKKNGCDTNYGILSLFQRRSGAPAARSSTTKLHVSELHVPGYKHTKLPFILKDEHLEEIQPDGTVTLQQLRERVYTPPDDHYESFVPYNDGHLVHKSQSQIFTTQECHDIVDEAERVASQTEWTKNRHGNYPTTDLPLVELPETLTFLRFAFEERIYPLLRAQFGGYLPDPKHLRVADGFVVKYDAAGGQKELKPHRDGSVLSFNIALNPASDFEGGGTWFDSLDDAIKIDIGQVVTHSSGILHGGHGITSGVRYIMVGFVILEGYDSWSMRFYNQVRNL